MREAAAVLTDDRRREFETVVEYIAQWARTCGDVRAVAVVGSWARCEANMNSDLDIVVLTNDTGSYLGRQDWIREAVGAPAELVRTKTWGRLIERRVQMTSGLEIEFGFVEPAWASTSPVDGGTRRVVRDGLIVLIDLDGELASLMEAVARR